MTWAWCEPPQRKLWNPGIIFLPTVLLPEHCQYFDSSFFICRPGFWIWKIWDAIHPHRCTPPFFQKIRNSISLAHKPWPRAATERDCKHQTYELVHRGSASPKRVMPRSSAGMTAESNVISADHCRQGRKSWELWEEEESRQADLGVGSSAPSLWMEDTHPTYQARCGAQSYGWVGGVTEVEVLFQVVLHLTANSAILYQGIFWQVERKSRKVVRRRKAYWHKVGQQSKRKYFK